MFLIFTLSIISSTSFANHEDSQKFIVISFDGMRQDLTTDYIDAGDLPNFEGIQNNGLVAEDIRTINPSLTMASHAAMSTGAMPDKTGIISNNLHLPNTNLTTYQSAFFSPLTATPIWSEAREQGKTTATVLFPGSNPTKGNQATYAVYYGTTWNESALEDLKFTAPKQWKELPDSYSPVKEATLTLNLEKAKEQNVYILAADTTDDNIVNYDTFYFYTKKNGEPLDTISENEWGQLSFPIKEKHLAGFSFMLKDTDSTLEDVKLYRTDITSGVIHGPTNFKEDLEAKFGFLPAGFDDKALENKWITRSEYEDIQERFAKWTTDVSLYIKEQYKPDILFSYYPQIDHEEHKYLLVDPRQPDFTKKKSKEFMNHIMWSYRLADDTIGEILEHVNIKDRLFIVSDHGMEPVHTMISPNHELEKAGLLVKDKDGKIDPKKSKAFAVASGAISHVYINLAGREENGIVSEEELPDIQDEINNTFSAFEVKAPSLMVKLKYLFYRWREDGNEEDERSVFEVLTAGKENPFEKNSLNRQRR